jgi:hypothetical protein
MVQLRPKLVTAITDPPHAERLLAPLELLVSIAQWQVDQDGVPLSPPSVSFGLHRLPSS